MRMRMIIGVILVLLLLLLIFLLVGAVLLVATGNPPGGDYPGVHGLVYSIEVFLAGMIEGAIDWVECCLRQTARLSGSL
jgi:hypothetical protein